MTSTSRTAVHWGARAGMAALSGGLLAAASLAAVPAAQAADDFLQISVDGTSFGSSVSGPVFADGLRLIPGSTGTASVWVRNTGSEDAVLTAAALSTKTDAELAGHLVVRSSLDRGTEGAGNGGDVLLGAQGTCSGLGGSAAVPAGATLRVDFAAGLALAAPNAAMSKQGTFSLLFLLDSAGTGVRLACEADDGAVQVPALAPGSMEPGTAAPVFAPAASAARGAAAGTGPAAAALGAPATGEPAAQGGTAKPLAALDLPTRIAPASFIESTVEPIIRTWQGALLVLLTVAFFAAAAVRTRITRRTK